MEKSRIKLFLAVLAVVLLSYLPKGSAFYAQDVDPEQAAKEVAQERKNIEKRYEEFKKKKTEERKQVLDRQEKMKSELKLRQQQIRQQVKTGQNTALPAVSAQHVKPEDTIKNLYLVFLILSIAIVVYLIFKVKSELKKKK